MQVCTSLEADNHTSTPPHSFFYRPDALPVAQPTEEIKQGKSCLCLRSWRLYSWSGRLYWRLLGWVFSCSTDWHHLTLPYLLCHFTTTTQQPRCLTDHTHTHTHPFKALFPGLPGWAGTRKVKPIWILLQQETVSGSDINWAICKSASRSRQITMPVPHHSSFFTGRMPFLPPNQQRQSTEGLMSNRSENMNSCRFPGLSRKHSDHNACHTGNFVAWVRDWLRLCSVNKHGLCTTFPVSRSSFTNTVPKWSKLFHV